jgi:hypothetical protein
MQFPQTEAELRQGLDRMKALGASPEELKAVIDGFAQQQSQPTQAKQPGMVSKAINFMSGKTPAEGLIGRGLQGLAGMTPMGASSRILQNLPGAVSEASNIGEKAMQGGMKMLGMETPEKTAAETLTGGGQGFDLGGFVEGTGRSIKEGVQNIPQMIPGAVEGFQEGIESIGQRKGFIEEMPTETGMEQAGKLGVQALNVPLSGMDLISKTIGGAVTPILEPAMQNAIEGIGQVLGEDGQRQTMAAIQDLAGWYQNQSPEQQEILRSLGIVGEFGFDVVGGRAGTVAVKQAGRLRNEIADSISNLKTVFRDNPQTNVIESALERVALTPDLPELQKQRTAITKELNDAFFDIMPPSTKRTLMDADDLKLEYMKQFTKSLQDDRIPTVYSLGRERMERAMTTLENKLMSTGSELGKFREKISTVRVSPDVLAPVVKSFDDEIAKKGLRIVDGEIVEIPGRKSALNANERTQLLEMRNDLIDIKENPDLQMLIDVRSKIDSDLNFLKDRRDISNNLDPIGKKIRRQLADINAQAIGKEQAGVLQRYSELSDILDNYRKSTSRGNNMEFFLKKIMSERDVSPKGLAEQLKRETGIDLIQDAAIIDSITSYLAPKNMRSRFEQEISRAVRPGEVVSAFVAPQMVIANRAIEEGINWVKKYFADDKKVRKAWEELKKNDEAMLELETILRGGEVETKGWSNVDEGFSKAGSAESATLYHGTTTGNVFDKFDPLKIKTGLGNNMANEGDAFYFTKDPKTAKVISYLANEKEAIRRTDPKTLQVPDLGYGEVLEFKLDPSAKIKVLDKKPTQAEIAQLKKQGYDGVEVPDREVYESTLEGRGRLLDELGDTDTIAIWNTDKVVKKAGSAESALLEEAKKFETPAEFIDSISAQQGAIPILEQGKYREMWRTANADKLEARKIESETTRTRQEQTPDIEQKADGYQMSHRPSKMGHGYNIESQGAAPDFYTNPQYYFFSKDGTYQESLNALLKIRNKPEAEVTVYRATPRKELNDGDWITLSKKYAIQESQSENSPVYAFKVKAKDIQFAGDDINEFGYFPVKGSQVKSVTQIKKGERGQ